MKKILFIIIAVLYGINLSAQIPHEETLTLDNYLNNSHNSSGTRSTVSNPDGRIIYQRSVGITNLPRKEHVTAFAADKMIAHNVQQALEENNDIHISSISGFCRDSTSRQRNSILLDFLGTSVSLFSLNYDRIIYDKPNYFLSANGGIGYFDPDFNKHITVPIALNLNIGSKSHYFEIGTGLTYEYSEWAVNQYSRTLFAFRFGYRYQRKKGGLLCRIALTGISPIFYFYDSRKNYDASFLKNIDLLPYIVGVSAGYTL